MFQASGLAFAAATTLAVDVAGMIEILRGLFCNASQGTRLSRCAAKTCWPGPARLHYYFQIADA